MSRWVLLVCLLTVGDRTHFVCDLTSSQLGCWALVLNSSNHAAPFSAACAHRRGSSVPAAILPVAMLALVWLTCMW
jgi:hypothetical protein